MALRAQTSQSEAAGLKQLAICTRARTTQQWKKLKDDTPGRPGQCSPRGFAQSEKTIEKAGNYGDGDHFLVRKKLCLCFAWCTVSILHYAGSSTLSGGEMLAQSYT